MGTLIGWKYPTGAALNLADHTYVACGTGGKAWSCWGGKSGGTAFVQGPGSTRRADAIAGHNERAGITCYLVNGVCHQAANRILFPSATIVRGARGYWVSEAVYGTYGRPRGVLGLCRAPFHKHPTITGDLPECLPTAGELRESAVESEEEAADVRTYIEMVASLYDAVREPLLAEALGPEDVMGFQLALFGRMVQFKLGSDFADYDRGQLLLAVRAELEDARFALEAQFARERMPVDEFTGRYNALIQEFQHRVAGVLDEQDYEALFELRRGDAVTLVDPDVARAAYGIAEP